VTLLSRLLGWEGSDIPLLDSWVRDKHHDRKHGPGAYYGQD